MAGVIELKEDSETDICLQEAASVPSKTCLKTSKTLMGEDENADEMIIFN